MNIWKRYELKDRAKQVLKVNYWMAFVVALILIIISGGLNLPNSGWKASHNFNGRWESKWENKWNGDWNADYDSFEEFKDEFLGDFKGGFYFDKDIDTSNAWDFVKKVFPIAIGFIILGSIIAIAVSLALKIFVANPLKMGCRAFYKESTKSPLNNIKPLGTGFRGGNYGNVVKTMFFRDLYTFLWTLLFIIPGIIKAYAYRMVPYILADNPKMETGEAIALSQKMMMGEKWKTFVLDLSFLGWYILGMLALGIGTLFVHPYKFSTDAQLYIALRGKALGEGYSSQEQLNLPQAEA